MSDAADPTAKMQNVPVSINAQYVKDLSFESPDGPLALAELNEMPEISLDADVGTARVNETMYEVALAIKAEAQHKTRTLFIVELVYVGVFTVNDLPKELLEPFLYTEAPRLIFPYARQIVSTVTRDGGFPPLMLQPINFYEMHRQRVARVKAEAASQKPN
jgi:preprotein translocase subunit SecB